jgi:hypothetical protein
MSRCLLTCWADRAIVGEGHPARQSGEFYFAIFEDFTSAIDSGVQLQSLASGAPGSGETELRHLLPRQTTLSPTTGCDYAIH